MREAGTGGGIDVTISVVSYNTKAILRDCLTSVFEHTRGASFEIVVVDNASADGSAQMVQTEFPNVRLVRNKDNVGFVRANNQTIRVTDGRYVFLLNSDTVLVSDIVGEFVQFMDSHPEAGAVSCTQADPDLRPLRKSYGRPTLWLLLAHFLGVRHLLPGPRLRRIFARGSSALRLGNLGSYLDSDLPQDAVREVDVISGACLFFRRDVTATIGLPDENFFLGPDDWDWCLRMKAAGWRVYLLPRSKIVHLVGASRESGPGKGTLEYYKGWFYFCRKHYRLRGDLFLKLLIVPTLAVKALRPFLFGYVLPSREKERYAKELSVWIQLVKHAGGSGG